MIKQLVVVKHITLSSVLTNVRHNADEHITVVIAFVLLQHCKLL